MKKYFLAAALALLATPSLALTLCTGAADGPYAQAGDIIAAEDPSITVVKDTGGTWANIKLSLAGKCDAFIGQPDGLAYLNRTEAGSAKKFVPVADLHREYLHALCSKESGVDDVGDLESDAPNYSIALGDRGSGAWLIWQNFISEDEDYAGVKQTDESGDVALSSVNNNQTTCMLVPAALKNSTVNTADELYGDGLVLAGVNDGDFNDAVDPQGKDLYTWAKIPSGTYPNSLQGWFSGKDTVSWTAKVYVNKTLVTDKAQLKTFIRAVMKARPSIIANFGA